MEFNNFGTANLSVSKLGYGTWGIGGLQWGSYDEGQAIQALQLSAEKGVNFYDTGLIYGNGKSEQLLSKLKKDFPNIIIGTKIPPKNFEWPALPNSTVEEVFPNNHLINSTEESLKNLQVEQIDLQQLHVWNPKWIDNQNLFDQIETLKKQGKINLFGVSLNDYQPASGIELVQSGLIDSIQIIYNIYEQEPNKELFKICRENNVGVFVRLVLDEGGLSGKLNSQTIFEEGDWRNQYFTKERLLELENFNNQFDPILKQLEIATLAELAIRFCMSNPYISSAIIGMRSVKHVLDNLRIANLPLLKKETLKTLKKLEWRRNWYPEKIQ